MRINSQLSSIIIALFTLAMWPSLKAQEVLSGLIDKDITLTGSYVVETNVKITKNATLTLIKNSKIIMKKGTSIKVEGGLIIEGAPNKFIEISGYEGAEGAGFIISGTNSTKPIKITYAHFSRLLIPISFENNWYRKKVTIQNNLIDNISTGEPGVIVRRPDELFSGDTISFAFTNNNFVANNSSILIDGLESNILKLSFNQNLLTDNYYYGFETGEIVSSPITTSYNDVERKYKVGFNENAIFANYLFNSSKDTILREINFAITGKGEKFAIPGNYFGAKTKLKADATLNHFSTNSSCPYLEISPILKAPSDDCHGFIYKVYFNGAELSDWQSLPTDKKDSLSLNVYFNREVTAINKQATKPEHVAYFYYNESKKSIDFLTLNVAISWGKDNKSATIKIQDDVMKNNPIGYLIINGFSDNEGFYTPNVTIGKNSFGRAMVSKNKDFSPSLRR